jgi:transaldolase
LTDGTLRRYIREFSVTGLTSNPTIFDKSIKEGGFYDAAIRQKAVSAPISPCSIWPKSSAAPTPAA